MTKFGTLALGDVGDDSDDARRDAGRRLEDLAAKTQPAHLTIGSDDSEIDLAIAVAARQRLSAVLEHALAVVGMVASAKCGEIGLLVFGETEQAVEIGGSVQRVGGEIHFPHGHAASVDRQLEPERE